MILLMILQLAKMCLIQLLYDIKFTNEKKVLMQMSEHPSKIIINLPK